MNVRRSLVLIFIGAPGEIRTPDHQVRSLVLYPAELRAHDPKEPGILTVYSPSS